VYKIAASAAQLATAYCFTLIYVQLQLSNLLHLLKNTFDRKRISANPSPTLTLILTP